jgi:hypothetical protein
MPTKTMTCSCAHDDQDLTYGKNQRVFNVAGGIKTTKFRCTVCGKETTSSSGSSSSAPASKK